MNPLSPSTLIGDLPSLLSICISREDAVLFVDIRVLALQLDAVRDASITADARYGRISSVCGTLLSSASAELLPVLPLATEALGASVADLQRHKQRLVEIVTALRAVGRRLSERDHEQRRFLSKFEARGRIADSMYLEEKALHDSMRRVLAALDQVQALPWLAETVHQVQRMEPPAGAPGQPEPRHRSLAPSSGMGSPFTPQSASRPGAAANQTESPQPVPPPQPQAQDREASAARMAAPPGASAQRAPPAPRAQTAPHVARGRDPGGETPGPAAGARQEPLTRSEDLRPAARDPSPRPSPPDPGLSTHSLSFGGQLPLPGQGQVARTPQITRTTRPPEERPQRPAAAQGILGTASGPAAAAASQAAIVEEGPAGGVGGSNDAHAAAQPAASGLTPSIGPQPVVFSQRLLRLGDAAPSGSHSEGGDRGGGSSAQGGSEEASVGRGGAAGSQRGPVPVQAPVMAAVVHRGEAEAQGPMPQPGPEVPPPDEGRGADGPGSAPRAASNVVPEAAVRAAPGPLGGPAGAAPTIEATPGGVTLFLLANYNSQKDSTSPSARALQAPPVGPQPPLPPAAAGSQPHRPQNTGLGSGGSGGASGRMVASSSGEEAVLRALRGPGAREDKSSTGEGASVAANEGIRRRLALTQEGGRAAVSQDIMAPGRADAAGGRETSQAAPGPLTSSQQRKRPAVLEENVVRATDDINGAARVSGPKRPRHSGDTPHGRPPRDMASSEDRSPLAAPAEGGPTFPPCSQPRLPSSGEQATGPSRGASGSDPAGGRPPSEQRIAGHDDPVGSLSLSGAQTDKISSGGTEPIGSQPRSEHRAAGGSEGPAPDPAAPAPDADEDTPRGLAVGSASLVHSDNVHSLHSQLEVQLGQMPPPPPMAPQGGLRAGVHTPGAPDAKTSKVSNSDSPWKTPHTINAARPIPHSHPSAARPGREPDDNTCDVPPWNLPVVCSNVPGQANKPVAGAGVPLLSPWSAVAQASRNMVIAAPAVPAPSLEGRGIPATFLARGDDHDERLSGPGLSPSYPLGQPPAVPLPPSGARDAQAGHSQRPWSPAQGTGDLQPPDQGPREAARRDTDPAMDAPRPSRNYANGSGGVDQDGVNGDGIRSESRSESERSETPEVEIRFDESD